VKPVVVLGSERVAVNEMHINSLSTWERKILSRTGGPVAEQGIWRIRTNQELRELHKDLDIVAGIKKKKLEWIRYAVRTDQGRTVKKISESKREGSIRMGRPRWRWLEDVDKNVREIKVKRWRQKAVDRVERASLTQETKVLRGPQSQGVCK
jgi:hypothetical protein